MPVPKTAFALLSATVMSVATAIAAGAPSVAAATEVEVTLPPLSRFVAVTPEHAPEAWLRVDNPARVARSAQVEWVVHGPDGGEVRGGQVLELAAGEDTRVPLPAKGFGLFGIYHIGFRVTVEDHASVWADDLLAVYPKNAPAPRGESVFPIGFATGAPLATPRLLELAASLGFEYHRFNATWNHVQPREGVWHWDSLDRHLALVESYGFRWHAMTTGSASWAAPRRFDPPPLDAWRAWIGALAKRYGDRIEFWEVWNEPNISFFNGTVEQYGELQRAAFDTIKAVAPQVVVTSGGYAGMNHQASKPGAFEAALRDYPRAYDWFAYHMHDTFPQFYSDLARQLAGLQQKVGVANVPLVFTETGFDTRFGERFQAETLVKKMTYAAAIGAKSYTWYNMMDRAGRDQPNKAGHTFGLITNPTGTADFASIESAFRPKESFVAAATAIRELRGRAHLETWAEDGRRFAYVFGRTGDHLLIAWSEGERTPGALWVVETDAERVEMLDLFGNATLLSRVNGRVVVRLDEPRYYRFSGGTGTPRLAGPLVETPAQVTPTTDGVVAVELVVHNPFDHVVEVTATAGGDGFSVDAQPGVQPIAAGASVTVPLRLRVGPGPLGGTKTFEVRFAFAGIPWNHVLKVPVVFNTIDAARGQTLALGDLHQVTNKRDHDPYSLHLLWGSPVDLSAQVSFKTDAETGLLGLTLEVTDNRHFTTPVGQPILDGDAIELGWAAAGGGTARVELAGEPGGEPHLLEQAGGGLRLDRPVRSLAITREGTRTTYVLELNPVGMGLMQADIDRGFRFNFAIHDNDGEGAKSWLSPLPGLGGAARFNPAEFPWLKLGWTARKRVSLME
jgi:hypothetical protein